MKKHYLLSILMLVMMAAIWLPQNVKAQVSVWDGTYAPWTNGTGTEADPFLIENAQQLAYLAYRVNNGLDAAGGHVSNNNLHYKLMTDVNLNGSQSFQWTPIGYWNSSTDYYCFGGHFDGNSHTVSGLYINSMANRVGFFGYTNGAEIKNLNVSGSTVATSGQYVGGIVGVVFSNTIKGCNSNCNLSSSNTNAYLGGIAANVNNTSNIINCSNTGIIEASTHIAGGGGIVGYISCSSGTIQIYNCYNKSIINIPNQQGGNNVGGIIGYSTYTGVYGSYFNLQIKNCYNTGSLVTSSNESNNYLGGIVGYNHSTTSISHCYNSGNIAPASISSSKSGAIVGYEDYSCTVSNTYYINTCGVPNTYGGTSMSSTAMQTSDFINMLNDGSCSWEQDVTPYTNDGYPVLTMIILDAKTLDAINVTQTHGTLKGTISVENDNILSAGFMYKASNATNYSFVSCNNVSDTIAYTLSGLTPSTSYSYRTYLVTAGCDTTFGTDKSFTTLAVGVTTNNPTSVTQSQATMNGTLSMGDATITSQGFEYMPNYGGTNWIQVTTPFNDNVSYTISGLIPNTYYAYRVFATTNECGTIYGQTRTFSTLSVSATTNNANNITQSHASLNGSFTIGDANMSAQGFEYKKSADTTYQIVNVSGEGNITETITGLTPSTQYVYRAFCTADGCETVYGTTKYFTTQNVNVTTNPATDLTESSATLNGTMNMGDATVTSKGFEYKTVDEENYTAITVTADTNVFSIPLYGLPVNTRYQYRAFVNIAENTETYYGATQTFEVSWLNADTIYIYDADMLQWVSDRCNSGTDFAGKYIKLMNNIVLPLNQPNNMTSIGRYPSYPFSGTFDGNGLTISNLYIDQPNTEYQGFFGYTLNANLYEVGLVNITASGRNYTGGMVAYAQNTYMRDCYVNGGTLFALSYCGGLVGYQQQGTNSIISGCYNTCTVSGNHYVGGLVGFSNYSTVRNSYVAASVAGQGNGVGAIIGGANDVLMYNCYFSSTITGQSSAIGENNFKDGEGLSDEEMRDPAFVATLNQGLVTPVWKSDYAAPINNGFPILIWQYSDAEACEAPENLTSTITGNSALLSWTGDDNANYFIVEYGKVGEEPQQENTPNATFTIHNVQEGNYFWRVKSVCSFGESNFVNGENITTGVNEWGDGHFTVYPNPTTGMVNVRLDENGATWNVAEIQMFDVYGRLLHSVETCHGASLQTTQIDLSSYAPGIYLIKLVGDGRVIGVRKVVKR